MYIIILVHKPQYLVQTLHTWCCFPVDFGHGATSWLWQVVYCLHSNYSLYRRSVVPLIVAVVIVALVTSMM